jgi:ribosomally synthesized peptide (two-chain TOMM family)
MNVYYEAPFPKLRSAYLRAIARAWRDEKYLQELVDASNRPRGALDVLECDFKFNFPFNVKFCISGTHRPQWQMGGSWGWTGFADEFNLTLPGHPARAEDRAAVLARYCAEFPTLLGATTSDAEAAPPANFAEFGVLTSRIIARTWTDDDFAKALYSKDDSRSFIQDSMTCVIPWHFNLRLSLAPGESSVSEDYWTSFPRSVITVHLPMQPALDVEPVALAAYNAGGAMYPFTCH